jgi:hypothetical protein
MSRSNLEARLARTKAKLKINQPASETSAKRKTLRTAKTKNTKKGTKKERPNDRPTFSYMPIIIRIVLFNRHMSLSHQRYRYNQSIRTPVTRN